MLERRKRPAQDFIENPLPHPQHQSREAGSCTDAEQTSIPHAHNAQFAPVPTIRDGAWAMPQIPHAMAPRSLHIRSRSPLNHQDRAWRSPSDAMRWFR